MIAARPRGLVTRLPDPDEVTRMLEAGYTLPADFYTDERIFALEDYWIWQRSWQPVGIVHELREPGDRVTATLGSVPVAVERGADGQLRAFVNAGDRGTPVAVDTLRGVVWVSVAPREPLNAFVGEAPAIADRMRYTFPFELYDDWVRVENPLPTYRFAANWKAVVENAIECYHCPTLHTNSFSAFYNVDTEGYTYHTYDRGIYQLTNFNARTAKRIGETRPHRPSIDSADFRFLYPYPNGCGIGVIVDGTANDDDPDVARINTGVVPVGVHESIFFDAIHYRRAGAPAPDPSPFELEQLEMLHQTFTEDLEACRSVQENMRTGLIRYGKTMPVSESSSSYLQRLWWEALEPGYRALVASAS